MKIAVLGAGSWGTAMARLLVKSGHDVCMYTNSLDQLKILETKKKKKEFLILFFLQLLAASVQLFLF